MNAYIIPRVRTPSDVDLPQSTLPTTAQRTSGTNSMLGGGTRRFVLVELHVDSGRYGFEKNGYLLEINSRRECGKCVNQEIRE